MAFVPRMDGSSVEILRELGKWWLWIREGQSGPGQGFAQHRRQQLCGGGGLAGTGTEAHGVFLPPTLTVCTNCCSFSVSHDWGPGLEEGPERGQASRARFVPKVPLVPEPRGGLEAPTLTGRSLSGQKGQPRAEAGRAGASRGLETALPESGSCQGIS